MAGPIRVGVLSFALYHGNFWSEVSRDSPGADFAGVWDEDTARGKDAAARYGVPFFPTPAALLERCDAVGICSPTAHHRALIEQSAAAGCHVLCEKPLATTLADCDRIATAIAAAGISFMQSFPKRFDPVNHELKRMLAAGELGRLSMARVRRGHAYGLDAAFQQAWFVDPALSGGGALLDEGMHGADLIRWLFGEPVSVMAMTANAIFGAPVEDAAIAVFRFASGLLVELAPSWCFPAADNSVELYGTGGAAILSGVDLASRDLTERLPQDLPGRPARQAVAGLPARSALQIRHSPPPGRAGVSRHAARRHRTARHARGRPTRAHPDPHRLRSRPHRPHGPRAAGLRRAV